MKKLLLSCVVILLFSFGNSVLAQNVTGKVTSGEDNSGIPGVNIIVKGTSNGVITDVEGNYAIDVEQGAVLSYSFVGFLAQDVTVGTESVINVTLNPDVAQLDELIVVGYMAQTRGDLTGSVGSVDMSEAVKTPMVNAAEALQGRVTGVTVVNSGTPGSAPKINIRGFGTSNNTNPLYIIDGVQTDDASVLNSINPSDIDQMNVLKDGAAAIYGARASNGVVIITTKSGGYNMDKAKLSVDMYTGVAKASNLPDLLNAQQHGDMIFESLVNSGEVPNHIQYGSGANAVVPSTLQGASIPVPVNISPNGTNWLDEIMRTAKVQNASISLQNGTATGKYYMSASFLNREGIQLNTGYKRASTRFNSEYKVSNKVRIGQHANISLSKSANAGNQINGALRMNPLVPVYDSEGNFAGAYANSNELGNTQNPVAVLERGKNNFGKTFRVIGDIYLEADLIDGLTAKTSMSGNLSSGNSRSFTSLNPEAAESISTNTLRVGNTTANSWTWTNTLNYTKAFDQHDINVLVGVEALKSTGKGSGVSRTGYLFETPDFYLLNNGSGTPNVDFAYDGSSTLFSVFGTANYSYADKYFVTATVRRDKSSRFKGDNKTGVFPAFSLGWALSEEDFFPQDGVLSRMKLKASYGALGNQTLPANNPTINISGLSEVYANYALDGSSIATGAKLSSVGNPNLRWETSKSTNIGVDLGMFDDALSVSLEWFSITTKDLIVRDNSLIPTTGPDASPPLVNLGSVKNTGVDFSIGYAKNTTSGLSYNINCKCFCI